MKTTCKQNLIAAVLVGTLAFTSTPLIALAQPGDLIDNQIVTDAYVYFLSRALVIRQEQTDLKEPGITYNVIKYNPGGSADFVNPNLDVAYLEAWIAVDDKTPVLMGALEVLSKETEIRYHISAAEKDMKVLEE